MLFVFFFVVVIPKTILWVNEKTTNKFGQTTLSTLQTGADKIDCCAIYVLDSKKKPPSGEFKCVLKRLNLQWHQSFLKSFVKFNVEKTICLDWIGKILNLNCIVYSLFHIYAMQRIVMVESRCAHCAGESLSKRE